MLCYEITMLEHQWAHARIIHDKFFWKINRNNKEKVLWFVLLSFGRIVICKIIMEDNKNGGFSQDDGV